MPQRTHRIWTDDAAGFTTRRITKIRHDFHHHPLMRLPALASLAGRLAPTRQCRFIRPGTRISDEFNHTPKIADGRGLDEFFARIEDAGSWVALYNVETDPEYRGFLDEVLAGVRDRIEAEQPNVFNLGGFIFISAPPSVTPFHIDRENNFWLQVAGRKTMTVWDHTDRQVVAAEDVEAFIRTGSLERVRLGPGSRERGHDFDVGPGDGVYFPSTSPHATTSTREWVTPGNGVSISIGVVFYSDTTRRHARVHQANHYLRRLGLTPSDPGTSAWRDAIKAPLGRLLAAANVRLRGGRTPPGSY
jgi:mannose-6-phosphate isomerase-like protein (cupin superfamily)